MNELLIEFHFDCLPLGPRPVDDFVDDSVLFCLLRVHDEVSLDVVLDAIEGLAGVLCH
jgi:hypothetical protein